MRDDLAARLLDRLDDTSRRFTSALDLGGCGSIAPALRQRGMNVTEADLYGSGGLPVDEDALPFPAGSFDLIIAAMSLHWVNDLPGLLIQLRRALRPEGLFLASMPVLGTLDELRHALLEAEAALTRRVSPRVSPYPELRDCAALLQRAGFAYPVADVESICFTYANPLALLHDLRAAGETNAVRARSRLFTPRALLPMALASLPRQDDRTLVTLQMAVMTGWGG